MQRLNLDQSIEDGQFQDSGVDRHIIHFLIGVITDFPNIATLKPTVFTSKIQYVCTIALLVPTDVD